MSACPSQKWPEVRAHCLNTGTAASELVITSRRVQSYDVDDANLLAGILTFVLMLVTFFFLYPITGEQIDYLHVENPHVTDYAEQSTQTNIFINHIDGFAQTEHEVCYAEESTQTHIFLNHTHGFTQTEHTTVPYTQEAFTQVRVQLRNFSAQTIPAIPPSSQSASTQTSTSQDPIYQIFGPLAPSSERSLGENLRRAKRVNVGLARELQVLRARVEAMPRRKARVDDVGDVYLCHSGRVWHLQPTVPDQGPNSRMILLFASHVGTARIVSWKCRHCRPPSQRLHLRRQHNLTVQSGRPFSCSSYRTFCFLHLTFPPV